ncbi:MAG: hypothetical protein KGJ86_21225, partial [Chloroflexota bacterium]|nr:hypothetical protein [Chloroflexota bacterium]
MNVALASAVDHLEAHQDEAVESRRQGPSWYALFGAIAVIYVAAAVFVTLVLHILAGDAMSRTASASFVVLSRDPHLAAIGFIWNPLPTFVQIPLVLILRPFGLQVLAGPLQSALFMAGASTVVWQLLGLYPLTASTRGFLAAAFTLNPLILTYAADGMSEGSFLFFLVGAIYFFVVWSRGRGYPALIGMAFMAAGGFMTRYEAIPFAAAGVFALVLGYLSDRKLDPPRLEASLLAYLAPVAYTVFLWMLFNWMIMGDPLFFQN